MMLNTILILTINTYKPLQTHCTKLIPHLGSTLQKLAILKIEVHFFGAGITILSQCRKICEVNNNFV